MCVCEVIDRFVLLEIDDVDFVEWWDVYWQFVLVDFLDDGVGLGVVDGLLIYWDVQLDGDSVFVCFKSELVVDSVEGIVMYGSFGFSLCRVGKECEKKESQ